MTSKELAIAFHEIYERLAPSFGYKTRSDTKQFDAQSNNGRLMTAVCQEIITRHFAPLCDTAKDAEIARLTAERDAALETVREIHMSLSCVRNDATDCRNWQAMVENINQDMKFLRFERDAAVKRATEAEELYRHFEHDVMTGRDRQHENLMARLAAAMDALNEIIGHGYTWPSTDPKSEDWRQGYSRGVSSVKSIAREALAALDAAKEGT